jgi:hypothetical protein
MIKRLTFPRSHWTQIAAIDLFMVPSVTFEPLYVFIIVRLARRDLQRNISPDRRADHTSNHEANEAPRYLIRDRDQVYGTAVRLDRIYPPGVHSSCHRAR